MKKMTNPGYLYYKKYYQEAQVDTTVNALIEAVGEESLQECTPEIYLLDRDCFSSDVLHFKTTYPGLLIGTGYLHEAEGNEAAYKLGLHFDHTTGLPIIPGHGVKGVLCHAFKQTDYIKEQLMEDKVVSSEVTHDTILAMFDEIFEGKNAEGEPIPMYQRDIFLEAVPVSIATGNIGGQKRLFGGDYLTPHRDVKYPELDGLSEPRPLKFLKVLPEVHYEFYFQLQGSKVLPSLTREKKKALFKKLLIDFGVGAKTNVGYGQLVATKPPENGDITTTKLFEKDEIAHARIIALEGKGSKMKVRFEVMKEGKMAAVGQSVKSVSKLKGDIVSIIDQPLKEISRKMFAVSVEQPCLVKEKEVIAKVSLSSNFKLIET